MADIALIFHWPPSEMGGWSVDELMDWHARALARNPYGDKGAKRKR